MVTAKELETIDTEWRISDDLQTHAKEILTQLRGLTQEAKANLMVGYLQETCAAGLLRALDMSKEDVRALAMRLKKKANINMSD